MEMTELYKHLMNVGFKINPDFEHDRVWFPNEEFKSGTFNLLIGIDVTLNEDDIVFSFHGDSGTGAVYVNINKVIYMKRVDLTTEILDSIISFSRKLANIEFPMFPTVPGRVL